jgi:hypothetical protein
MIDMICFTIVCWGSDYGGYNNILCRNKCRKEK